MNQAQRMVIGVPIIIAAIILVMGYFTDYRWVAELVLGIGGLVFVILLVLTWIEGDGSND